MVRRLSHTVMSFVTHKLRADGLAIRWLPMPQAYAAGDDDCNLRKNGLD